MKANEVSDIAKNAFENGNSSVQDIRFSICVVDAFMKIIA
jgi:hypothetical protein